MGEKELILEQLPLQIRRTLEILSEEEWLQIRELRFRLGQPVQVVFDGRERWLPGQALQRQDMEQVVLLASRGSIHAVLPQLRQGYLTLRGGHRLGICGNVRMRDGAIHAIEPISSINLRLARQIPEAGVEVMDALCGQETVSSTLILAPPGAGKTTLLRNIIQRLSDGVGCRPHRIGLADERGEVAALYDGVAQLDVGVRTDVMEGCPKAQAMMLLLRGMNPQILAADEITAPEDVAAMQTAAGCGVCLLATAHGGDRSDLERRKLYRSILEAGIFQTLLTIRMERGMRRYGLEALR